MRGDFTKKGKKIIYIILQTVQLCFLNGQTSATIAQGRIDISNPFNHKVFIENNGQFNRVVKAKNDSVFFFCKITGNEIYLMKKGILVRKKNRTTQLGGEGLKGAQKNLAASYRTYPGEENSAEPLFDEITILFNNTPGTSNPFGINKKNYFFSYPNQDDTSHKSGISASAYEAVVYENIYPETRLEIILDKNSDQLQFLFSYQNSEIKKQILFLVDSGATQAKSNDTMYIFKHDLHFSVSNVKIEKDTKKKNRETHAVRVKSDNAAALISVLTFPATSSQMSPYDVDYDSKGNMYIYGGNYPYEEMKFDSIGNLQWVYVTSLFGPYTYYGDFAVDKKSGSSYIAECWNFASQVIKLNSSGVQVNYFPGSHQLQEIYRLQLNACTGQLIIAGGAQGTNTAILDTTFSVLTPVNIFSSNNVGHDFCMMAQDRLGFVYLATTGLSGIPFNNVIVQAPASGLQPLNYITPDNYDFQEAGSIEYISNNNKRAGYNGIAASNSFLYTCDGKLLQRWSKHNGVLLDSVNISSTPFLFGGLEVNACEHLFIAKGNQITEMDSAFNVLQQIPAPDTIYDLKFSNKGLLYLCGKNFISSIKLMNEECDIMNIATDVVSCSQSASASVATEGGSFPYTYVWNPPVSTTNSAVQLPEGEYMVTVSDNACYSLRQNTLVTFTITYSPEVKILSADTICEGNFVTLTSSLSGNLLWSTGDTTQSIKFIPDSTLNITLLYDNNLGCKDTASKLIVLSGKPDLSLSGKDTICEGEHTVISVSGAEIYLWNNGEISTAIEVQPNTSVYYYVVGSNGICANLDSFFIHVIPLPQVETLLQFTNGVEFVLTATGGNYFHWVNGEGINCDTCKVIKIIPERTDTFCVQVKNSAGCQDSSCLIIYLPSVYVPDSFTPNNDGLNDIFIPVTNDVENYVLTVFSKWGDKLFESNETYSGWNGWYQGGICPNDVYAYLIRYQNKGESVTRMLSGKVTLIK